MTEHATAIPAHVHGTNSGYRYWGCRCADCTYVSTEAKRRSRAMAAGVEYVPRSREELIDRGLLRLAHARPDWYQHAKCKGNTKIMFDVTDPTRALAICATCPVQDPCRTQARRDREQGTWGGETEVDRYHAGRGSSTNVVARNKARQQEAHRGANHAEP